MQLRTSGLVVNFISVFFALNALTVQADFFSALSMQQDPPIEFSSLVEFSSEHRIDPKDETDNNEKISLATFEVGMHADVSRIISADILWAYQEELDSMMLDAMTVSFDLNSNSHSTAQWQGAIGRDYLPFGAFMTFQVNDTLGLELAERNQLFSGVSYHGDHTLANVYVYENEEGAVGKVGGRLGFHDENFQVELDYIDSLYDAPAYGIHGYWIYSQLTLLAEFIMVDHFDLDRDSTAEQVEVAYDFGGLIVAASYQVSDALDELELAKEKASIALHTQVHSITHLGLEVFRQDGIANILAQLSVML